MPVLLLSERKGKGCHPVLKNNDLNISLQRHASPTAHLVLCNQTKLKFGLLYCTVIS